jgi:hypothetical protein
MARAIRFHLDEHQQFPVSKAGGADGRPASRYARDLVTLLR